jgi:hypothetical protein
LTKGIGLAIAFAALAACGYFVNGVKITHTKGRCYSVINNEPAPSRSVSSGEYCIGEEGRSVAKTVLDNYTLECNKKYCLRWRMVLLGAPIKNFDLGVFVGDEKLPRMVKTDDEGFIPVITTDAPQQVVISPAWLRITVPEGADDYERSRNK